ncbi:MAG: endonuclease/exonuclease/phosphatase family protein [Sedimentisphaerales bacterium]|nr:endonuclease/exonuclease/phosphatase family protein [Sedimentisphaerales bacterium]
MRLLRCYFNIYKASVLSQGLVILGLLLHATVKDRIHLLAIFFYGLPPVAMVLLNIFSLTGFVGLRRKGWALLAGLLLPVAIVFWIQTDYVSTAPRPQREDAWTVVLWNIARPAETEDAFVSDLLKVRADIVILIEAGVDESLPKEFWDRNFPDYKSADLGWGMTLLCRFPVKSTRSYELVPGTHTATCELITPGGSIVVMPVDLDSNPIRSRKPGFEKIFHLVTEQSNPVILAGDFNTPHTSIYFTRFRQTFKNVFEETGNGWIPTWSGYIPILALDHIWLSPKLTSIRTEYHRNSHSDHAMIVTQVAPAR